jgi:hypothetical protein
MRRTIFGLCALLSSISAFAADTKSITLEAGGKPALTAEVPKDAEVTTKKDKTTIATKEARIYIWPVASAKSVADAAPHAADIIKSEFVKFDAKALDSLKVMGHEAKHLTGKGEEADDNDPGTADVIIFTDGKHVFAACVHGEGEEAAKQRPELLKLLKSAKPQ